MNSPVEKNKQYIIEIIDMGSEGEGVGKIDNLTVFVPGATVGDKVCALIVKVKKSFAYGKLIEIVEPSSIRCVPKCDIASKCGGCQLQHITYQEQLRWKTQKVEAALTRIGGLKNIKVKDTLGMEVPFNYRNKSQYPIRMENGKLQIGFFAKRSHRIIPMTDCVIQDKRDAQIIEIIRTFLEEHKISIYDETKHTGLVRHLVIRTAYHTKEIMACLVINGKELPHSEVLVERLREVEGMCSILLSHNTNRTNVILGGKITTLYGRDYIIDRIGNLEFKISLLAFFQVNPLQTKVLYDKAVEYAELTGNETVWDAYCGIGTISLFLAEKAKKVYGVEIVAPAIENARENASLNELNNTEFFVGKAEEIIPEQYKSGLVADTIVVDPPRKGCDPALLETLVAMAPNKIVYVSCDPATLARDLNYLTTEGGYQVVEVQPVDMFPHTTHCETVVKLVK